MMKVSISLLVLAFVSTSLIAQDKERPRFGSSDQVDNQLALDDLVTHEIFELPFLNPYFDFKKGLKEKYGFSFGVDYSALYFGTNSKMGDKSAGSGMVRLYGSWDLVGRESGNTGSLVYKIEHRHAYGSMPVSSLGFDVGYVGMFNPAFNDDGFRTTNLYWKQRLGDGRFTFVVGFLDVTDFFDVYALASPWMHFNNYNFSTGLAAVGLPNDGYLGFAGAALNTVRIYTIFGLADQNSDPTQIFKGFDTFFNQHEFFKHIEVGYTSAKEYVFLDNIHLSYWHRDQDAETLSGDGWGLVFSGTKYINETWLPFFRAAYTKDGGSLLQAAISTGLGFQPNPGSHLLGIGLSWGQVNESTYGEAYDGQYLAELFYRIQFSSRFTLTPDLQFVINPALNTEQSSMFIWGIQGRLAL
jgi:porin